MGANIMRASQLTLFNQTSAFDSRRTGSGAFGSGLHHCLDCHRPPTPGFDDAA